MLGKEFVGSFLSVLVNQVWSLSGQFKVAYLLGRIISPKG